MIRGIIEISLAVLLALPVAIPAAEQEQGNDKGETVAVTVRAQLSELAETLRLTRGVREFAEEYSLFDAQLYGRLNDTGRQQEQIDHLQAEISSSNRQIEMAKGQLGFRGDEFDIVAKNIDDMTPGQREIVNEVLLLEGEVAAMEQQMHEIHVSIMLPGDSELLDASLWQGVALDESAGKLLEQIESMLKESAWTANQDAPAEAGGR